VTPPGRDVTPPGRDGAAGRAGPGRADAEAAADALWAAIGDPMRRRLLDALLAQGEATATSLAAGVPITRQAVAKHLAVLEAAGLVEGRRQGREVRFVVRPAALGAAAQAMAAAATDWDQRLVAIKRLAEAVARRRAGTDAV
jgi:DNA-binding transcriptional ArsR family regulator